MTRQPMVNEKIKITFLNCIHAGEKNAYIGMKGIVVSVFADDSFTLKCETNSLYVSPPYQYEIIK